MSVGPGLAQLVERLAHRYSESTSSNTGNLTSATVCVDRTDCVPCSSRGGSRGTYIMFASTIRIRRPTLALKPRGDVTRNPKQGCQWPQKRTCVSAKVANQYNDYIHISISLDCMLNLHDHLGLDY